MQAIETLTGSEHELMLEREKAERDLQVRKLRDEQAQLEAWLERKRTARQREEIGRSSGPSQTVVMPPLRLGGN